MENVIKELLIEMKEESVEIKEETVENREETVEIKEEPFEIQIDNLHNIKLKNVKSNTGFTFEEDKAIVGYLLEIGGLSKSGGNKLWKKIAVIDELQGRSWQSIKNRFRRYIITDLDTYGTRKEELEDADSKLQTLKVKHDPVVKGAKTPYSQLEDNDIIKFIAESGQFGEVGGVLFWQRMEKLLVVPGRSWQSLKQRFHKQIRKRLSKEQISMITQNMIRKVPKGEKKLCIYCEKNVTTGNYLKHLKKWHTNEFSECPMCGKSVHIPNFKKHMIQAHKVKKHKINKLRRDCNICYQEFPSGTLSWHRRKVHFDEKPMVELKEPGEL